MAMCVFCGDYYTDDGSDHSLQNLLREKEKTNKCRFYSFIFSYIIPYYACRYIHMKTLVHSETGPSLLRPFSLSKTNRKRRRMEMRFSVFF